MPVFARNLWRDASDLALDAVFPPRCVACGNFSQADFCASCRASLQPIAPPFCTRCGEPFQSDLPSDVCADCRDNHTPNAPPFDAMRSVFAFEGAIRRAVHRFKYEGKWALAKPLAQEMFAWLENQSAQIPLERIALIAPVPLHSWRRFRRGYNQSALLAQELAAHLQKVRPNSGVLYSDVLRRTRYTSPQVELGREARGENVRGAFASKEKAQLPRGAILLIDDVCTTGATIRECAAVLKQNGAEKVFALTLAR